MNEENFMNERVEDQINWYDRKSQFNQKRYKRLRIIEIFAAALIPFLSGYISAGPPAIPIIIGSLVFIIAVISGLIGLQQYQERWMEYRTTCESLRHEKYLFLTKTDPYGHKNPFPLFVQRIEALLSSENSRWSQMVQSAKKEEDPV